EAGAAVTIGEVSAAGEVPALSVVNDADRPVLLLDGEELVGARQNRILNTTVLVAAQATLRIPVSCVEQGRWSYRGKRFETGDAVSVAGRWVGLDLLAAPGLFARGWPTLCAGYAAEGLGREAQPGASDVRALLARIAALTVEEAPAVGLGHELRIAAQDAAGAALVVEDRLAHLMV